MANEFKIKKGLIVTGASGGTVVDIQGSQGQLFSVTDDLSGSIFAVSDISGVPILDVNSNGTIQFSDLSAGTLVTDANGNISVSSGGGAGGPYLPLSAGSGEILTGDLAMNNNIGIITKDTSGAFRGILKLNSTDVLAIGSSALNTDTIFKNTGNVGIGTTSPSRKLHVVGGSTPAAVLDSNQDYTLGLARSGTEEWWLKTYTDGRFAIHENGSGDKVTIKAGGNVGIGTASPDSKLHVESNLPTGANFILETTHTGGIPLLDLKGAHSAQLRYKDELDVIQGRIDFGDSGTFNFLDVPNSSSTLYLKTGGNVGIGTTSPTSPLTIKSNSTSSSSSGLTIQSNGNTNNIFELAEKSTDGARLQMYDAGVTKIALFTDGTDNYINAGNVGIGTTSPLGKLMVRDDTAGTPTRLIVSNGGTAGSGTSARLSFYEGTSEKGYIERRRDGSGKIAFVTPADDNPFVWENPTGEIMRINNSNVGIGTTSPSKLLTLNDASGAALQWQYNSGNYLRIEADSGGGSYYAAAGLYHRFFTSGSERMRITSTGKVGIGTTSPAEKLDVDGNVKIKDVLLSNQENTDIDSAAAEVVAQVAHATYTAAFFDFVVKKGTNVRSGTVYACHDGTNVEFTETSTNDLGDTSDVTLSVDISGANMRLLATVTSDDWSVKSLIRAI